MGTSRATRPSGDVERLKHHHSPTGALLTRGGTLVAGVVVRAGGSSRDEPSKATPRALGVTPFQPGGRSSRQ